MEKVNIKNYGFDEIFQEEAKQFGEYYPGRVLSQAKNLYRVICAGGEITAEVSGKFMYNATDLTNYPTVGDFVMLDRESDDGGSAIIHHVLKRKSVFVRKAAGTTSEKQLVAANIDTVFICMSLNNDFNLRRLERYVSIAFDSGAVPIIILTKSDLCSNAQQRMSEAEEVAVGVDIIMTTAMQEDGYSEIIKYLKTGNTASFIGSSGVGKSTLINRLCGNDELETNGLRNDDKGRHTTTKRELIMLKNGSMVIDTPGMRELGISDISEGVDRTFSDIEALACECRFADCSHNGEPGCAVFRALNCGELSEERWNSYLKLKTESEFSEDKASYLAAKKEKFKSIAKYNKSSKKR